MIFLAGYVQFICTTRSTLRKILFNFVQMHHNCQLGPKYIFGSYIDVIVLLLSLLILFFFRQFLLVYSLQWSYTQRTSEVYWKLGQTQ